MSAWRRGKATQHRPDDEPEGRRHAGAVGGRSKAEILKAEIEDGSGEQELRRQ